MSVVGVDTLALLSGKSIKITDKIIYTRNEEGREVILKSDGSAVLATLDDLGDKISGEEKAKVETEIEAVKKALESNNTEAIKEATDKLTKVFYELSEKLYSQNPNAGATAEAAGTTTDDNGNVYNADYKVEDEGNNE